MLPGYILDKKDRKAPGNTAALAAPTPLDMMVGFGRSGLGPGSGHPARGDAKLVTTHKELSEEFSLVNLENARRQAPL